MASFTKGPWSVHPKADGTGYGIDGVNGEAVVWIAVEPENGIERLSDAELIAASGTAATRAEEMGYDGLRAIEALPKLLDALDVAADPLHDMIYGDGPMAAKEVREALAQALKENSND